MLNKASSRVVVVVMAAVALAFVSSNADAAVRPIAPAVPIEIHALLPPWTFTWGQVLTYQFALISNTDEDEDVTVAFNPYEQIPPDMPPPQKGGIVWYYRHYRVPGRVLFIFSFRVMVSPTPIYSANSTWCLYAAIQVEGTAEQGVKTCALPDSGK